jgi:hypothetical protein
LASAEESADHAVIEWMAAEQERAIMRRRATWCAVAGWLLMSTAAVISFVVAMVLSGEAQEMFTETYSGVNIGATSSLVIVPALLGLTAAIVVVGGLVAWRGGWFPGWSRTMSAIDWSSVSDAVARLVAVGCTYPEAFRLAAEVAKSRQSRSWLRAAADRVEHGEPAIATASLERGDTALLESLVETAQHEPARHWSLAANHFLEVATRRLVLFLQSMPMISTLVAGLLVWIAIASTLGWMWRAVRVLMQDMGMS